MSSRTTKPAHHTPQTQHHQHRRAHNQVHAAPPAALRASQSRTGQPHTPGQHEAIQRKGKPRNRHRARRPGRPRAVRPALTSPAIVHATAIARSIPDIPIGAAGTMGDMPTPLRNVRVDDELWSAAQEKARGEGRTLSVVVVELLRGYLGSQAPGLASVPTGSHQRASSVPTAPAVRRPVPTVAGRVSAEECQHPPGRRLKGLCGACGTYVGLAAFTPARSCVRG